MRSSRPPASSHLLPPHLPSCCYRSSGWGYVILVLGVSLPSPPPPHLLRYSALAAFTLLPCNLPPLAPSFPHFPLTLFRSLVSFTLPVPAPSLSLSLSFSLRLPPLVAFFLLWVSLVPGLGGSNPSDFGGSPLPPLLFTTVAAANFALLPVASCFRLTLHPSSCLGFLLVLFMSFRQCAFFYYSFFFSLDSPSLPFVFGAAHLYFFGRCGGVVRCLLGLFLGLILFPPSFPFLGLLLVSAGFFVCDLLCLFFLRALPVMSLG